MSDPRNLRFAIIGAGMAGVASAIKLREAGHDDWVIYEKGDCVGGTWRENTYPGLTCDVPSHIYSYSFEPNPEWSHRFSPGAEIREYFEGVARRHGVLPRIRFDQEIERLELSGGRWRIQTRSGVRDEADVVIAATGVLHHPKYPEIEGLDGFAGACFHSARWDHSVPLDGRRIGVIGTGSTAVQITGALVPRVARFSLFQRTAQWIAPQENPPYTDQEKEGLRRDPAALRKLHDTMARDFHETFSSGLAACPTGCGRRARSPRRRVGMRFMAMLEQAGEGDPMEALSPGYLWTGRVLSGIAVAFLLFDASGKLMRVAAVIEGSLKLGYPESTVVSIGVLLLVGVALYVVPRTAVLGAVYLAAYLGGAVASHYRLGNPLATHVLFPVYVAAFIWGGLALRNPRLLAVLVGGR
jgi:hypothetical protein